MFSILCYKCNKSVSARSYRVVLLVFNEPWKDFFFSRRLCNFALPSPMYISPIPHLHLVLHWFLAWWVYNDITILFFVCNTSKVQHPFLYLSTKWIYSLLKYLINKSPSLMPIWIFHFQILEPHTHTSFFDTSSKATTTDLEFLILLLLCLTVCDYRCAPCLPRILYMV